MTEIIEKIRAEPLQKRKAELRTQYGLREVYNPMLSIPADLFQYVIFYYFCDVSIYLSYKFFRSTPVECLHTILLGPYKYLLKCTIPTLSSQQKEEVLTRVKAFNYSGFDCRVIGNVIRHHQSFVGRDYKAWAQMALYIIYPYLSDGDKEIWVALSKVYNVLCITYYR